jgi:hypothetical protein
MQTPPLSLVPKPSFLPVYSPLDYKLLSVLYHLFLVSGLLILDTFFISNFVPAYWQASLAPHTLYFQFRTAYQGHTSGIEQGASSVLHQTFHIQLF